MGKGELMIKQNLQKLATFILFSTVFSWCAFSYLAPKPFFDCEQGAYTFYLYSKSSSAKIVTVNASNVKENLKGLTNVKGQSLFLDYSLISKEKSLTAINNQIKSKRATLAFTEEGEWGKSEYYYSPLISDFIVINGYKINLHVVISEKGASIGSPILFGSY